MVLALVKASAAVQVTQDRFVSAPPRAAETALILLLGSSKATDTTVGIDSVPLERHCLTHFIFDGIPEGVAFGETRVSVRLRADKGHGGARMELLIDNISVGGIGKGGKASQEGESEKKEVVLHVVDSNLMEAKIVTMFFCGTVLEFDVVATP